MSSAVPNFADPILLYLNEVLLIACLVIDVWAFISCLTQRADAFAVVGTLPKGAWLAIIGLLTLLTAVFFRSPISIVGLVAIAAAAIYLLDVRPAIRDAVDGQGPW